MFKKILEVHVLKKLALNPNSFIIKKYGSERKSKQENSFNSILQKGFIFTFRKYLFNVYFTFAL